MLEKRIHPRFLVEERHGISFSAESFREPRLISLSMGGCGFRLTRDQVTSVRMGTNITCQVQWPGVQDETLHIKGMVRYGMPAIDNADEIEVGIQFPVEEHSKMTAVAAKLEQLLASNEIYRTSFVREKN